MASTDPAFQSGSSSDLSASTEHTPSEPALEEAPIEDLPFSIGTPLVTYHVRNGGRLGRHSYVYAEEQATSPAYFAKCSEFRKRPDLVVYRGGDDSGEVLGGAALRYKRDLRLLLGGNATNQANYAESGGMGEDDVIELASERTAKHSTYFMTVPAEADPSRGGRPVQWRRTSKREDGVRGAGKFALSSKTMRNYIITDHTTGDVVGVYLQHARMSFSSRGRLILKEELEDGMKDCLLVAALGLAEKSRRKAVAIAPGTGAAAY